jgi:16S rRNA (cytosine967-C5)-methyltransferase
MRPSGRLQAAIEIIAEIEQTHRPAGIVLSEWGKLHRFAGSADRSVIGDIVYDALRQRASIAEIMSNDRPRSLVLGVFRNEIEYLESLCDGSKFAPSLLSSGERSSLAQKLPLNSPAWIAGNYPEWLTPYFSSTFDDPVLQGKALACRAPIDLRVNTLKTTHEKVMQKLTRFSPQHTGLSPVGIRIAGRLKSGKNPNVEAETAHGRGWFEVQDEGSQIAALMSGCKPGQQVGDICTGAGGKALAIAAMMENKGQIHASDINRYRLRPILERLKRAGVHNTQVHSAESSLDELSGKLDVVVADVPCSGSGAWRRRPDAKWRFTKSILEKRLAEQRAVLKSAAGLIRPGGRLVYITCSLLEVENDRQIAEFQRDNPQFYLWSYRDVWMDVIGTPPPETAGKSQKGLLLTPANHSTDGFFVAIMERSG